MAKRISKTSAHTTKSATTSPRRTESTAKQRRPEIHFEVEGDADDERELAQYLGVPRSVVTEPDIWAYREELVDIAAAGRRSRAAEVRATVKWIHKWQDWIGESYLDDGQSMELHALSDYVNQRRAALDLERDAKRTASQDGEE